MSRYVVIGGAGFIGSHLVDALLASGHDVTVIDNFSSGLHGDLNSGAELVEADARDSDRVREALQNANGCFHLATSSLSGGEPADAGRPNVLSAVIDAACRAGGVPVVYASSRAVYGNATPGRLSEDMTPVPADPEGQVHLAGERCAAAAFASHRLPSLGLRLFDVYGPRQRPESHPAGMIPRLARWIRDGDPAVVDGQGQHDFLYVADAVRHLLAGMALLTRVPPAAFVVNACTGRATTETELALLIGKLVGCSPRIEAAAPARVTTAGVGDPARALALLGVATRVCVLDGVTWTIGHAPIPGPVPVPNANEASTRRDACGAAPTYSRIALASAASPVIQAGGSCTAR